MLKRTPMSRGSGFKRPQRERLQLPAPSRVHGGTQALITDLVLASPKGEKARPGKRTPTVAESRWMDFIVGYGCIACRLDGMGYRPPAVHHILRGGVRMGHLFTLPLCDPGHHQGGQALGLISRHPWKQQFEQRYGTEQALLEILQKAYAALDTRAQPAINSGAQT